MSRALVPGDLLHLINPCSRSVLKYAAHWKLLAKHRMTPCNIIGHVTERDLAPVFSG